MEEEGGPTTPPLSDTEVTMPTDFANSLPPAEIGSAERDANTNGSDTFAPFDDRAKQRGRPFQPGQSGNPGGRPKGSRNKTTLAIEALLDDEAETITRKVIELAKAGDSFALRLLFDRLLPPPRGRPVAFDLVKIESVADAKNAASTVLTECAEGRLAPAEANEIMNLLANYIRTVESADLVERLIALEKANKGKAS
jgi:Family of unknown function (DUF5681)